ncbi:hypothetical protein Q4I32_004332 [Leishmania shawi]|uniref:START domain-containing protein n=1 Tax=Leishmania shawi TaxID=5680 RepID=A0AAW3BST2_9TRYP
MTYLLHSSSYAAAVAAAERDAAATRDAGDGPLSALVRRVNSVLHGGPSQVSRASNIMGDGSSGSLKHFERSGGASSTNLRELPLSSRPGSARAARAPEISGFVGHSGGSATPAANASHRLASTPVAPSAGKKYLHRSQCVRLADAASDAGLYERAVDYADLEEVLRCPLPPVPGCPTPCAFGWQSVGLNGDDCVTAAAAPLPPPPPSPSPQSPLVFRCIAADADTGISVYSTPVEECPMHLMRAYAVLPCSPGDVLQYMESDIRPRWDSHIRRSALLRELSPPEQTKAMERQYRLSTSIGTAGAAVGQRNPTSLSEQSRDAARQRAPSSSRTTNATGGGCGSAAVSVPTTAVAAAPLTSFQYLPGQRRVAIHHLETRSPVPFAQDRDFEIVVAEEIRLDGTAYMKAFSTPLGYHMPLTPHQSRYVRAVVVLSGMVACPLDAACMEKVLPPVLLRHHQAEVRHSRRQAAGIPKQKPSASTAVSGNAAACATNVAAPRQYCVVEYVGLIHPMGMLPAVMVNMVISAQLNAMRKMQAFITQHPISTLRPRHVTCPATGEAANHPLQELMASLSSSSSSSPALRKNNHGATSRESGAVQRTYEAKPGASGATPTPALLTASRASSWWRRQAHRFASHL